LGGAHEDVRRRARESAQMRIDHADGLRRIAEEGEVPEPSAVRRLVEAVLALSDNPRPENVERYLAASRALEGSRSGKKPRESRAA
jgi:hypothetical protein